MQFLRVLLVNPPIFDFTAFDFWLRPYGMLRVAGQMRNSCDLSEPLSHNKTAFAIRRLGVDYINQLKQLTHSLNLSTETCPEGM